MVKKYGELYDAARKALRQTEGEDAAFTARELLCFLTGKTVVQLLSDRELYASEKIEEDLNACLARLLDGEPLAYVMGERSFYGLPLKVTPDVLIPRDDTMAVTELAIEEAKAAPEPQRVLDLCTGSGCIGLAVARYLPTAKVTMGDISKPALQIAKENAAALKLSNRVTILELDATKPVPAFLGQFDVLVSNPPYITKEELPGLPRSVRDFEPVLALDGGEDGLDFYRAILENYLPAVKPGGAVCFEFGYTQHLAVGKLMAEMGLHDVAFRKDGCGVIRAAAGRKIYEQ